MFELEMTPRKSLLGRKNGCEDICTTLVTGAPVIMSLTTKNDKFDIFRQVNLICIGTFCSISEHSIAVVCYAMLCFLTDSLLFNHAE